MADDHSRHSGGLRVFLSHCHRDQDVAKEIGDWVANRFHNLVHVFRSTDPGDSIRIGDEITSRLKEALQSSCAFMMLCSHDSVRRPWVNIEFGAAWMLDVPVLPLCIPGFAVGDLPFQVAATKVCTLADSASCLVLAKSMCEIVRQKHPDFSLQLRELRASGEDLRRRVGRATEIRLRLKKERSGPLRTRLTVWLFGSYRGLRGRRRQTARKLIPELAHGLVDRGVRVVMGESDMLKEFAREYRDAGIGSPVAVPPPVVLPGKLRQRDLGELFQDAIGTVPSLAILVGGNVERGRVQEEYDCAVQAGIPVLPVPATGGVAELVQPTADRANYLQPILSRTGRQADTGDLATAVLEAVCAYMDT